MTWVWGKTGIIMRLLPRPSSPTCAIPHSVSSSTFARGTGLEELSPFNSASTSDHSELRKGSYHQPEKELMRIMFNPFKSP